MSRLGKTLPAPELLLKRPHTTEKAANIGVSPGSPRHGRGEPVYVFEVAPQANKTLIRKAVAALYKVRPRRVNIINVPPKKIIIRGKTGVRPGYKKAVVYLKKGDKIDQT